VDFGDRQKWGADDDINRECIGGEMKDFVDDGLTFGRGQVHFPVTSDEGASHHGQSLR